jgi:hypothetical protein
MSADMCGALANGRFVPWHVGLSEGHVSHSLALRETAGNVSLACRILRQHDATRGESTDVTIARLEFDLAGAQTIAVADRANPLPPYA